MAPQAPGGTEPLGDGLADGELLGELLGEALADGETLGDGLDDGLVDGELLAGGAVNWARKVFTSAEVHVRVPLVEVLPSTGLGVWSPSNAAHWTGYPARQPA